MPITLYHYTDQAGAQGISNTGVIRKSRIAGGTRRDARYGEGVYFTSLPPYTAKQRLAVNNFDGAFRKFLNRGKLDYYVEVVFSDYEPNLIKVPEEDRDIYLYEDYDLFLGKYAHAIRKI